MRQTTKFYAVLLCAALGFSTSIQSCKDYDDDIDSLNERIDAVNKSLEDLKKRFRSSCFCQRCEMGRINPHTDHHTGNR